MLISIITATYNNSSTILRCVESVNNQSWPDVEHIIIDGASADNTVELIRSVPNRVVHLVSEPDRGIYDALNKGLHIASGDIIGFLHADDCFFSDDTLRIIAETLSSGETTPDGMEGCYGDLLFMGGADHQRIVRTWKSGPFDPKNIKWGWTPPHPSIFLRKEVYQQLGRFDPSFAIAGDYDFQLRLMLHPGIQLTYLPEVITRMSHGGKSTGGLHNLVTKSREDLRALRKNGIRGPWLVLLAKILRKLPQFFLSTNLTSSIFDSRIDTKKKESLYMKLWN